MIHVQDHHIIVERKPDGLHVTEIMVFQNGAKTAYLGVGVNHASASGMRIGLPSSVKDFKPGLGLDESTARLQGRELTSSRPIPPGQRPVSFTYTVPLSGRMDLSHRVYFPTHQFTVMLDDPTLHLELDATSGARAPASREKTYALYIGSDVPVGSEVSVRVGGAGFFSNPKVYPFLAAPFVIAGVLIFASRRGRRGAARARAAGELASVVPAAPRSAAMEPPPVEIAASKPRAPGERATDSQDDDLAQVYLYLIAALDQGAERGEFSRESQALVRGNLKRRLEVILSSEEPRTKSR